MKRQVFKTGSILLVCLILTSPGLVAQELTKEFNKEWTAGSGTTLDINNKYGKVIVETSDQDRITIDVKVTVEFPNRERAQKYLDYIDVTFNEEGDILKARTVIDEKFNFSGWGGGTRRFSIDYTVTMPSRINFNLVNRYGNSEIEKVDGLVKIDIKYGNLLVERLTRGNEKPVSTISIAYGKAEIGSAGWIDLVARYVGELTIDECQALLLDSKYSKISIDKTSSVVAECRYDKLTINNINNLVLDAGYTDINIGKLSKKLKFDGGYGSITVESIPAGFESIETNSRYIGVRLGIESGANYELDARTSYGELKFDENNFSHQRRIVENNSSEISGIAGSDSSPLAKVYVRSSYGSVKLY
ncbi:MAG: hypothetical protein WAW07_16315 [Bacteroidales bacterium]